MSVSRVRMFTLLRDFLDEFPAPDPEELAENVALFQALPSAEQTKYAIALVGDLWMVLIALRDEEAGERA